MKKALPKIKKSIKSFILEEDAKILDETATKIALGASILAIDFSFAMGDANALFGHSDHDNHVNHTNELYSNLEDERMGNELDSSYTKVVNIPAANYVNAKEVDIDVVPKEVETIHANHHNRYDHSDDDSF